MARVFLCVRRRRAASFLGFHARRGQVFLGKGSSVAAVGSSRKLAKER